LLAVVTQSQQGCIPEHKGKASLSLVEGRVDYMSMCVVLFRATHLEVEASDSWKGLHLGMGELDDAEQASIQVEAAFTWQDMQLAIHRSTTQNFFNIVEKMYHFVMQQKRRSERTISNMLPAGSAASKALQAYRIEQQRLAEEESAVKGKWSHIDVCCITDCISPTVDSRHHWLWAVKVGGRELMHILGIQPPKDAHHEVSLGGNIAMFGQSVCIVCFHGPSFRETERAVFSIDQVMARFSTQAIPGLCRWQQPGDPMQTHLRTCQQIVELHLGKDRPPQEQLATIHRVSTGRSQVPNITGTPIKDWLAYAGIDSHLHEERYSSDTSTLVRLSRKLSIQPVLLVPTFSVKLINDHAWPLVHSDSLVPHVDCTLTSSFSAGISVTTTVDHYLFLHDVVKAYVEYLKKHTISKSSPCLVSSGCGG
jgi:hypothetical protein